MDFNVLVSKYFPFVPTDADNAKCARDLVESQLMLYKDGLLRFKEFTNIHDPVYSSEDIVYEHLVAIADSIGQYETTSEGRTRNRYHYQNRPSTTIHSNIPGSNNKTDACITSDAESSPPTTHDIAVPAEYKLNNPDRYDVRTALRLQQHS